MVWNKVRRCQIHKFFQMFVWKTGNIYCPLVMSHIFAVKHSITLTFGYFFLVFEVFLKQDKTFPKIQRNWLLEKL